MSLVIGAFIARPTLGTDATNMGLYNSDVIADRGAHNTPAEYRWYYLSIIVGEYNMFKNSDELK